jgi:ABC-type transport system involved in multi-copper enzyme maturation permease subunit
MLFAVALLAALWLIYQSVVEHQLEPTLQQQAVFGRAFFTAIASTQLALVLMIAPVMTAGAVCMDKARGTLLHVLVTDLTDREIVLGKLGSRLLPILGLLLTALPVLAISTLFGGVDPRSLTGAMLVTLGAAVLSASIAFVFSIWTTKPQEALMATYLVILLWILSFPAWWMFARAGAFPIRPPEELMVLNPFIMALDTSPGREDTFPRILYFLGCGACSILLHLMAIVAIRPVTIAHASHTQRRKRLANQAPRQLLSRALSWIPGPSLDGNPVLWREWHRSQSGQFEKRIGYSYIATSIILGAFAISQIIIGNSFSWEIVPALTTGGLVPLGMLLVSITAPSALAEERIRGSLDVLLTTPMSTDRIVWGKWIGAFRRVPFLALMPFLLGLFMLFRNIARPVITSPGGVTNPFVHYFIGLSGLGLLVLYILSFGAAINSLGLLLATWIPQVSRAIAITVGFVIFMTIGWFLIIVIITTGRGDTGLAVAMGSPFMGAIALAMLLSGVPGARDDWEVILVGGAIWTLLYAVLATALLCYNRSCFDRAMGRIPDIPPRKEFGARARQDGSRKSRQLSSARWDAAETGRPQDRSFDESPAEINVGSCRSRAAEQE